MPTEKKLPEKKFERIGLVIAIVGLIVSIAVAFDQSGKTREALRQTDNVQFVSAIQNRISNCTTLAAHYASQSWQYSAINLEEYEDYGLPDDREYYGEDKFGRPQPNQLLEIYSEKAVAAGRALQLCLIQNTTVSDIQVCIHSMEEDKYHWVDDSEPRDGTLDNIIC